jgi:hypothetical protein
MAIGSAALKRLGHSYHLKAVPLDGRKTGERDPREPVKKLIKFLVEGFIPLRVSIP